METHKLGAGRPVYIETGTLTVSVDIEERISSTLQFVTESGGSVAVSESPVPPACK